MYYSTDAKGHLVRDVRGFWQNNRIWRPGKLCSFGNWRRMASRCCRRLEKKVLMFASWFFFFSFCWKHFSKTLYLLSTAFTTLCNGNMTIKWKTNTDHRTFLHSWKPSNHVHTVWPTGRSETHTHTHCSLEVVHLGVLTVANRLSWQQNYKQTEPNSLFFPQAVCDLVRVSQL